MDDNKREALYRKRMEMQAIEKTWRVPGYEGHGPLTMTLRVPDVTISDSEGRFIVISPRQASVVGVRLDQLNDWLQYGDEDWVDSDDADEPATS